MSDHIRFKRPFQPRVIEPHGVLLLSERGQFLLRGRGYTQVAPFLDGKHTVDEITTQLDNRNTSVTVASNTGKRTAIAATQRFDDDGLREAVRWAEAAAKDGPGEQEQVRLVKPRTYPEPPGLWSPATSKVELESRIQRVGSTIERTKGYFSAGSMDVTIDSQLVANTENLVAYCRNTGGTLQKAKELIEEAGGTVVATVEIYDRLEAMVDLGVPNFALAGYRAPENYEASACPLCLQGMPVTAF